MQPVMSADAVQAFLDDVFPQVNGDGRHYSVVSVAPGQAVLRLEPDQRHVRPGGTLSGPTLFTLADLAAFVAILAHIGLQALTVTTNVNINFLNKPPLAPVDATCRILKLGKRLVVVDVAVTPADETAPILAHATATYSIPPAK